MNGGTTSAHVDQLLPPRLHYCRYAEGQTNQNEAHHHGAQRPVRIHRRLRTRGGRWFHCARAGPPRHRDPGRNARRSARHGRGPYSRLPAVLKRAGFVLDHTTGSHHFFRHPNRPRSVPVPFHHGDIKRGLLHEIYSPGRPHD
ncbi:MAG: type II toxin-antitoxin system HicA family toxin [Deltaproteobacteria bacterium]|nr:type II toxin-antitoxin system HicA family toxin [Deltaproteobacteria bacterium]